MNYRNVTKVNDTSELNQKKKYYQEKHYRGKGKPGDFFYLGKYIKTISVQEKWFGNTIFNTIFNIFFNSKEQTPEEALENERLARQINDVKDFNPIITTPHGDISVPGCTAIRWGDGKVKVGDLYYWDPENYGGKKRRSTKKRKSKRSHKKRGRHTKRIR